MPEIISRKEAMARGLKRYFTGHPCSHGHLAERYCSGTQCFECVSVASALAHKRNPEKRKEYSRRWADKNPDKARENAKRWNEKNPEKRRSVTRQYFERNRDLVRKRANQWKKENPEKVREQARRYRLNHKEKLRALGREYDEKRGNLIAVLRKEMPELLKEFGL